MITEHGKKVYEVQNGFFLRQVFAVPGQGTLWRFVRKLSGEVLLSYMVDRSWSEVVLMEDHTSNGGNMAFECLCHILPGCGLKLDTLTFHGVLMEYAGYGIIISAPSGTGKTTHARLWRNEKGALILNGDRAVCRKIDRVWTGFGLPWSGTSGEQINRSVPIKAVVTLGRGKENATSLIRGLDAFGVVAPHMLYPTWDMEMTGRAMDLLDDFLKCIPVIHMRCLPEPEAVEVLEKTLEEL